MSDRLIHRRLAILMGLAGLLAFAAGAGFEPLSAVLAGAALITALFRRPGPALSARLEHVWLPIAVVLVARALWHVFVVGDDVVIPVVDLLLLLLAAESLRSLDSPNDVRLYALSFALLLASTAYRPGLFFLLAFVAYVVLATVALTLGHVRRSADRFGGGRVRLGRPMVVTTVSLSMVSLGMSAVVFITFPRVSRGWSGRGDVPATSIVGFSDEVSLGEHGSQIYGNPQIVLRVEFPDGPPAGMASLHWRGRSYDHFDGVRWSRTQPLPPASAPTAWYRERWPGDIVRQQIYAAPLDVRVIFALHPILDVDADSRIQPLFDNAGDYSYWGSAAPVYTAWSTAGRPTAEQLREVDRGFAPSRAHFLQLPRMPDRVHALADSLTSPHATAYDKVVAVERWLRTAFSYTLDLPATAQEATLDHFLFERRAGHCEYFSSAMVVLLRSAGIHARNVNGFLGGEWSAAGDYLAVTQNQAHSWVEVWFPGYGWVTFDPTPPGAGVAAGTASWFWPGRFAFDALQHRWNKWVLDYSIDTQFGVFDRIAGAFENEPAGAAGEGSDEDRGWVWLALAAAAVLAAILLLRIRGSVERSQETRAYLAFVDAARRAGFVDGRAVTPLALVESLEREGHPAAGAARRLVSLYLDARFGGRALAEEERAELADALRSARGALRRSPAVA
ncbi:MAG: DUF3488 and transglutaminase-like domain-containing protein [Gemmatimonadetes bacterium]|nr:DUF3488 and transglutaminase-like domain-containing protein [Gemmatimonadota bacterium]